MLYSNFLRAVLKLDAASCLGMAALVLPFAGSLAPVLGLDAAALSAAAASLIPIGLFILWAGTRREAPAAIVYLIILGNLGWTAASLATAFGLPGITGLGTMLIAGQGVAVLVLALLEWRGVRQSLGSPAAA